MFFDEPLQRDFFSLKNEKMPKNNDSYKFIAIGDRWQNGCSSGYAKMMKMPENVDVIAFFGISQPKIGW